MVFQVPIKGWRPDGEAGGIKDRSKHYCTLDGSLPVMGIKFMTNNLFSSVGVL